MAKVAADVKNFPGGNLDGEDGVASAERCSIGCDDTGLDGIIAVKTKIVVGVVIGPAANSGEAIEAEINDTVVIENNIVWIFIRVGGGGEDVVAAGVYISKVSRCVGGRNETLGGDAEGGVAFRIEIADDGIPSAITPGSGGTVGGCWIPVEWIRGSGFDINGGGMNAEREEGRTGKKGECVFHVDGGLVLKVEN